MGAMAPLVVCVGLTTIDVVQQVVELPRANAKIVAHGLRVDVGGPAANAARVAAALGCQVRLVTALGGSDLADLARNRLDGIEIVDVAPADHQVPVSTVLVTPDGARAVVSRNATGLTQQTLPSSEIVRDADVVLHDGHLVDASTALAALSASPIHLLDGGSWKPGLQMLLPSLDVAVVSADFALPGHSPEQALDDLAGYGIPRLARTHGAQPVVYAVAERPGELPVPDVKAVDTTGAGDVLHGALAAHLAEGLGFVEALRQAIDLASRSVTGRGVLAWHPVRTPSAPSRSTTPTTP